MNVVLTTGFSHLEWELLNPGTLELDVCAEYVNLVKNMSGDMFQNLASTQNTQKSSQEHHKNDWFYSFLSVSAFSAISAEQHKWEMAIQEKRYILKKMNRDG